MYKKTLALSALVGFIIGIFWKSDWQWSLEAAQVVAGIISLPANNPMAIFATHLYAPFLIWPQVGLLRLGFSSEYISVLFSGLQSGFSFLSVTALLLVLSKDRVISIVIPIIFAYFSNSLFAGHSYDIFFPTNLNNGGVFAFYTVILAIASLGAGNVMMFMLLLGILPILHPGMAMGVWLGAIGYYIIADQEHRKHFQKNIRWMLYGFGFFVATVIIHRLLSGSFFEHATATEKQIVDYFVTFVDGHRRPKLLPLSWGERLGYFEPELMLLFATWLFSSRYKRFILDGAQIVLKFLGAMCVIGMVMTILWEMYSLSFPNILKTVMYARWLNFDSIMLPLFLVGAMSYQYAWRRIITLCMIFILGGMGPNVWRWIFIALICCLEAEINVPNWVKFVNRRIPNWLTGVVALIVSIIVFGAFIQKGVRPAMVHSPSQSALISKISQGEGLYISSYQALPLPQAMTNRGLVFNLYWIDTMTYVPTMADEMETILRDVYGISIFDRGIWPSLDIMRTHWENRTLMQWQAIKAKYNATDVLVPKSWILTLPVVIQSETLTVYHIP